MFALFLIVIGLVVAETIAQYCIQKSRKPNHEHYFIIALIAYAIVCVLLYRSFDFTSMSVVNALWNALSFLLIVAIGSYFYNEEIKFGDMVGLMLILSGTLLMFIYRHHGHK